MGASGAATAAAAVAAGEQAGERWMTGAVVAPAREFAAAEGYRIVAPDAAVPAAAAPLFQRQRAAQEAVTWRLRGGVVLDPPTGLVFRDGVPVAFTGYVVSDAEAAAAAERCRRPAQHIPRRRVFGARNRVADNYFHWLVQCLPAVWSYRAEEGFGDGVLLVPPLRPAWSASLSLLAIPLPSLVVPTGPVLIDDLTVSGLLYETPGPCAVAREAFARLAERAAAAAVAPGAPGVPPPAGGPRIYVWRADTPVRPMRNEDELVDKLAAYGIEPVVLGLMPLDEQIRLFRQAELVVGPHGAGLGNLVFCRPGTRLFELLPEHYVNPIFNVLAQQAGLEYWFQVHRAEARPGLWRHQTPWTVDLPRFERGLDKLLEGLS